MKKKVDVIGSQRPGSKDDRIRAHATGHHKDLTVRPVNAMGETIAAHPTLGDGIVDGLLLAAVLGVSWTKLFINLGGKLDLPVVTAVFFVTGFCLLRAARNDWRLPRIAAWLAGWSGIMLIIGPARSAQH